MDSPYLKPMDYVCGGWQTTSLNLLSTFHKGNEMERAALKYFDYGPIQSRWGGHQAVVVYPKDGDWWKGIVLDGWPNQVPEVWSMDTWVRRFGVPPNTWGGIGPSETYSGQYPMTGGKGYPDPGSDMWTPDRHREILRRLPDDVALQIKKDWPHLSPAERQTLIDSLLQEYPDIAKSTSVSVESPVLLLITDSENKRVGWVDPDTFVYEIPGVDFDEYPKTDGTRGTVVLLPMREYQVRLTAVQSGSFRYSYGIPEAGLFASPFTPVSPEQVFQHALSAAQPDADLVGPDGLTIPVSATTFEELFVPLLPQEPTDGPVTGSGTQFMPLVLFLVVAAALVGGGIVLWLTWRRAVAVRGRVER